MIAGETENIIGLDTEDSFYEYDEFLGFGKNKNKKPKTTRRRVMTAEEIAARKEKRKNFWSGLGNTLKDNGGLEGVTGSIGNIFGIFKKNPTPTGPTDFQFGVGNSTQPDSKKVPTGIYVVGGAVVIGLVVWGVTRYGGSKMQNGKTVKPNPAQ